MVSNANGNMAERDRYDLFKLLFGAYRYILFPATKVNTADLGARRSRDI